METFGISHSLFEHLPIISKKEAPKVEWEFQQVCIECEEYFGKNPLIWTLPYKKNCTENIIRDSLKICKNAGKDFKYMLGIIRNKTK